MRENEPYLNHLPEEESALDPGSLLRAMIVGAVTGVLGLVIFFSVVLS